ncbi:unnamed protein product [Bursaphelenchus xylophilus]|uniref:(pine wood nematode) hypothetical protein n=1 Tax=Bursaphelenchus xylophilus TaxID=6326 RepID=A0A1I7S9G4_BURXY|nr:unnamed protein product [Bursaphelenchus xylophilus]CAG9111082.1 unnamed protein product [Bursaphelenchus xylophilus]
MNLLHSKLRRSFCVPLSIRKNPEKIRKRGCVNLDMMDSLDVLVIGDPLFGKSLMTERFANASGAYCVIEPYIHKVIHRHINGQLVHFTLTNLPDEHISLKDITKANAIILLFDEEDAESLDRLRRVWMDKFAKLCENALVFVCGITSYIHQRRLFFHSRPSREDIQKFVRLVNAVDFFSVELESSAQICQVFDSVHDKCYVPMRRKKRRSLSPKSLSNLKFW